MELFITNFIESYGVLAIFLLIVLENVFPPIPSEMILLIAGFFGSMGNLHATSSVLAATLGSLLGAYILYGIGRLVPKDRIYHWTEEGWMKKLGFKKDNLEMVVDAFEKKGKILVLVGRCIPIIRSLISIPAGMVKMSLGVFSILTFIGSLVWNCLLFFLGYLTGENWHVVISYLDIYKYFIVALMGLLMIFLYLRYFRKKK